MQISVIVPTYNGANKIKNLLAALEYQNQQPYEIIIIIDGSRDNTFEVIRQFQLKSSLAANIYFENITNSGRSIARNYGASLAKGDLLLFFDDDMRPEAKCLQVHQETHTQAKEDCIIAGNQLEEECKMLSDIQKYKAYLSRKWVKSKIAFPHAQKPENLFCTAAHMSLPRQLFKRLGGFDRRYSGPEDWELAMRCLQHQCKVYFQPKAMAWHDDFITCKSYIAKQKAYLTSGNQLKKDHPEWSACFSPKLQSRGLKRLVYKIAHVPVWPWLIDHINIFKIFPKSLRYKIYDIIITAGKLQNS